jgi:hypothetical protein
VIIIDPESWRLHRPWAWACGVVVVTAAVAYTIASIRAGELVGGSSGPGLVCGGVAGLIIVYEMLFALRHWKRLFAFFLRNPAQVRLRRHIWLGLLCLPLAVLHSGIIPRGSPLAVGLLAICIAVVASGVWGLILQHRLPGKLLQEVPCETIASQIPELTEQMRGEASLLVLATCGPRPNGGHFPDGVGKVGGPLKEELQRVRDHRATKGTGVLTALPLAPIAGTEPLRDYFEHVIAPFLRDGVRARIPLNVPVRAAADFHELRQKLNPVAHPVVDLLEELCERRRLFDRQERLQLRLKRWLWIHLPLSVSLMILLFWHAVTALMYW